MLGEASLDWKLYNETRNCLLHETKHNDLISKKYKKTCKYLNYVEIIQHILASIVTGWVPISASAALVAIPVGSKSSTV